MFTNEAFLFLFTRIISSGHTCIMRRGHETLNPALVIHYRKTDVRKKTCTQGYCVKWGWCSVFSA